MNDNKEGKLKHNQIYGEREVYELLKAVAETCPKLICRYGGEKPPFGTDKRKEFEKELKQGCNGCVVLLAESGCRDRVQEAVN